MGQNTRIEWTDTTWNPWQGCHKVSPGCAHCYMYRDKARYGQKPHIVVRSQPATFNAPLHFTEPQRVFTCSWSDFFVKEADPWRGEAWEIIRATPHLTYQILTKRPVRIRVPWVSVPWPNVWLGTSVENQRWISRIDFLHARPAAVKFLSLEPLLGPLHGLNLNGIDWVIVGGESGAGARPMEHAWVEEILEQCRAAQVPFFFKQGSQANWPHFKNFASFPRHLQVREFPTKP